LTPLNKVFKFESGWVAEVNFVDNKEDKLEGTVGLLVNFWSLLIPNKLMVDEGVWVVVATTFLEYMISFKDWVDGTIVASNKEEKSGPDCVVGAEETDGGGSVFDKRREEKSGPEVWVVGTFVFKLEVVAVAFKADKSRPAGVFTELTLDNKEVRLESNVCRAGVLVLPTKDVVFVTVVGNFEVLNKEDKSISDGIFFNFESNEACVDGTGVEFCFCGKLLPLTSNEGGDLVNLLVLVAVALVDDKREVRLDVDTKAGFEDNKEA